MKNPDKKVLDKAITLRVEGYGMKQILATTGLSHSQAELAIMAFEYYIGAGGTAVEPTAQNAADLRALGISWGRISVMMGLQADRPMPSTPESKVRRMFVDATDTESVGLRIGRGGRWFDQDASLYEENLKATGTRFAKGEARSADRAQVAQLQKLLNTSFQELKAQAKDLGISVPKGAGAQAKLAAAIHRKVNA